MIMGDLFPRKEVISLFSKGKVECLFDNEILSLIKNADYSICNLEGTLSDKEERCKKCGPHLVAPTTVIKTYSNLGVNSVNMANNHTMDGGIEGFFETIGILKANKIQWFGAGKYDKEIKNSELININGVKVAIYGVAEQMFNAPSTNCPGVNIYSEERTINQITELKHNNDLLIVLYHGGQEFYSYPSPLIRERFHLLSSYGADVIIAQHSHQLIGKENYGQSEIIYGQGNTHFMQTKTNQKKDDGVIVEIDVEKDSFSCVYHYIFRDGLKIKTSEMPEWFVENSQRIERGELFLSDFYEFSRRKLIDYLPFYRGVNHFDKIIKRITSRRQYEKYLLNKYSENQLLRILNSLRCDEHREALITAIEQELHLTHD